MKKIFFTILAESFLWQIEYTSALFTEMNIVHISFFFLSLSPSAPSQVLVLSSIFSPFWQIDGNDY